MATATVTRDNWETQAACKGTSIDTFFGPTTDGNVKDTTPGKYSAARDICRDCPVLTMCRAVNLTEEFGVFGGQSELERQQHRAAMLATAGLDVCGNHGSKVERLLSSHRAAGIAVAEGVSRLDAALRYKIDIRGFLAWLDAAVAVDGRKVRTPHCAYGHERTPENTYRHARNVACKPCALRRQRVRRAAAKAAKAAAQ